MAISRRGKVNHTFYPKVLRFEGIVNLNASAAVLNATSAVKGGTWAKTGTGEYTFTLQQGFKGALACLATVQSDTDVDITAQIDSIDVSNGTSSNVVIKTMAAAVPTDVSAAASIHFYLSVQE